MPDLRLCMKAIEEKIGETSSADRIKEEPWYKIVIGEVNKLSKQYAIELGKETQCRWNKKTYALGLEEAPPTRLLSLAIILSGWLGWIFQEKENDFRSPFHPNHCLGRIVSAFEYGRELSHREERP